MRLVLDTNVWLDWLVFDDPAVAPLKRAVAEGSAEVFIDEATAAELARVLAYPFGRRTLAADAQAGCLAECCRVARRHQSDGTRAGHAPVRLPACRDPDDQKFLELALACGASFLLTKDQALLDLARGRLPFRVVTPAEWGEGLRSEPG